MGQRILPNRQAHWDFKEIRFEKIVEPAAETNGKQNATAGKIAAPTTAAAFRTAGLTPRSSPTVMARARTKQPTTAAPGAACSLANGTMPSANAAPTQKPSRLALKEYTNRQKANDTKKIENSSLL